MPHQQEHRRRGLLPLRGSPRRRAGRGLLALRKQRRHGVPDRRQHGRRRPAPCGCQVLFPDGERRHRPGNSRRIEGLAQGPPGIRQGEGRREEAQAPQERQETGNQNAPEPALGAAEPPGTAASVSDRARDRQMGRKRRRQPGGCNEGRPPWYNPMTMAEQLDRGKKEAYDPVYAPSKYALGQDGH